MYGLTKPLRLTRGPVVEPAVLLAFLSALAVVGCAPRGGGGGTVASGLDGGDRPALAMSSSGYAVAVWEETGTGTQVAANTYVPLARWGLATGASSGAGALRASAGTRPSLRKRIAARRAFRCSGRTPPAPTSWSWVRTDASSGVKDIFANDYDPQSGWGLGQAR